MKNNKELLYHLFTFNKGTNGGEQLILITKFFDNGDGPPDGVYTNQELVLNSYSNTTSFSFSDSPFTPETLRKLANELESAMIKDVGIIEI